MKKATHGVGSSDARAQLWRRANECLDRRADPRIELEHEPEFEGQMATELGAELTVLMTALPFLCATPSTDAEVGLSLGLRRGPAILLAAAVLLLLVLTRRVEAPEAELAAGLPAAAEEGVILSWSVSERLLGPGLVRQHVLGPAGRLAFSRERFGDAQNGPSSSVQDLSFTPLCAPRSGDLSGASLVSPISLISTITGLERPFLSQVSLR